MGALQIIGIVCLVGCLVALVWAVVAHAKDKKVGGPIMIFMMCFLLFIGSGFLSSQGFELNPENIHLSSQKKDNGSDTSQKVENDAPQAEPNASAGEADSEDPPDEGNYSLMAGTLLDANPNGGVNGDTLVIKAKIEKQLTNNLTIQQNYHNVEDIVKNQGGDQFNCIDYWAVADMSDGSEQKVFSFTIDRDTIEGIHSGEIVALEMQDYVDDLFIHQSLRDSEDQQAKKSEEESVNQQTDLGEESQKRNSEKENDNSGSNLQSAKNGGGDRSGDNFNTYDNEEQQHTSQTWVLNTSSMKIHYPSCSQVKKIAPQNYSTSDLSERELIAQGYTTCGVCHK